MADRLRVKEHLRNSALYRSATVPSLDEGWKRRLLYQYTTQKFLEVALWEKYRLLKLFVYAGIPLICVALAFAMYLDYIPLQDWSKIIPPAVDFKLPPIGLKEALLFIAIVNGLTFLIKKRVFSS
jgi:hypothetical protein